MALGLLSHKRRVVLSALGSHYCYHLHDPHNDPHSQRHILPECGIVHLCFLYVLDLVLDLRTLVSDYNPGSAAVLITMIGLGVAGHQGHVDVKVHTDFVTGFVAITAIVCIKPASRLKYSTHPAFFSHYRSSHTLAMSRFSPLYLK